MEHDSAAQDADDAFDALDIGAASVVSVTITGQVVLGQSDGGGKIATWSF